MRAHGEIQIDSTPLCRTIYYPDSDLINTLCENYEFACNGGTESRIDIEDDTRKNATYYRRELRDTIKRDNIIVEERGAVDGTLISRTLIGAGTTDDDGVAQPVWTEEIWNDGSYQRFICKPGAEVGHKFTVKPDGQTTLEVGGKFKANIGADGTTNIDVGPGTATITITPSGAVSLVCKAAVSVKTDATLDVEAKGATTMKTNAAFTVEAKGKGKFKANQIEIDGGSALEDVLCFPTALSDFTGLPVKPASKTVKVSK
jgi:hypothetical protein